MSDLATSIECLLESSIVREVSMLSLVTWKQTDENY